MNLEKSGFKFKPKKRYLIQWGLFFFALVALVGATTYHTNYVDTSSYYSINGTKIWKTSTCVVDASGHGDYTDIKSCIDSLDSSTGGFIFIKNGTYTVTEKIYLIPNLQLQGEGHSTIIKMGDNFPADNGFYELFSSYNRTSGTNTDVSNTTISHLTLDGNKAGNSGADENKTYLLFIYNSKNVNIMDVDAHNSAGYGLVFDNVPVNMYDCEASYNDLVGVFLNHQKFNAHAITSHHNKYGIKTPEVGGRIENCYVYSNTQDGIWLMSHVGEDLEASYKKVIGCTIRNNGRYGIWIEGKKDGATTELSHNNTIAFNHIYANSGAYSIYGEFVDDNMIIFNNVDKPIYETNDTSIKFSNFGDFDNDMQDQDITGLDEFNATVFYQGGNPLLESSGDTMTGNLDMDGNYFDNVNNILHDDTHGAMEFRAGDSTARFEFKNSTGTKVFSIDAVDGSLIIGDGTAQKNITMTSPDGSEFCCGVANDGTFSCSSGAC